MIKEPNTKSDLLGIMASTICMIHCLLTPFLFAIKACSVDACCESSPWWWKAVDILFLTISFVAVYKSYQDSTNFWVKSGLIASWLGLSFIILNEYIGFMSLPQYLIYIPAGSLVVLHYINRKYCSCEASCVAHRF